MRVHSIFITLIACCLQSLSVNSAAELFMIRQIPRKKGDSFSLTCMTEDDRSALVWNHDLRTPYQTSKFPTIWRQSFPNCAIIAPSGCRAWWKASDDWKAVNSGQYPAGPVFDTRWEDFPDLSYHAQRRFNVNQSGAVIFSTRGLADMNVKLCEIERSKRSCFEITIPAWPNGEFGIHSCSYETTGVASGVALFQQKTCDTEKSPFSQYIQWGIDAFKWRTFTLKWDEKSSMIKFYGEAGLYLQKRFETWRRLDHLLFHSSGVGRIRFHFYDYYLTRKSNTKISAYYFQHTRQNFCIDLLVNLCNGCDLVVSVIDTWNKKHEIGRISGDGKLAYDESLTWRVAKLEAQLENFYYSPLTLEIVTILAQGNEPGWWAIDSIRECGTEGTVRMAKLTFHESGSWNPPLWPIIGCQKLPNGLQAMARSDRPPIYNNSRSLQKCNRGWMGPSCAYKCIDLCKATSICDQSDCICFPGFKESDRNTECSNDSYGYKWQKISDSSQSGGQYGSPPSSCKTKLGAPDVSFISATTARLKWVILAVGKVRNISISIKRGTGVWRTRHVTRPEGHTVSGYIPMVRLLPKTLYRVKVEVTTICGTRVESPEANFTTSSQSKHPQEPRHFQGSHVPESTTNSAVVHGEESADTSPIHPTTVSSEESNLGWLAILWILLICLFILLMWRRRVVWNALRKIRRENIVLYSERVVNFVKSLTTCTLQQQPPSPPEAELSEIVSTPGVFWWTRYSRSVNIDDLEEYVRDSIASKLLKSQFLIFPKAAQKSCKCGSLPENKSKNRYANILPYDGTRVVLKKMPDDPYSDYINANYVQGFHKKKAYIATQGPKPQTVLDFWRMIWQEEALVICMLANLHEGKKPKCEQYWPEFGASKTYGDIVVVTEKNEVFADYTFRTFRVSCKEESRKIEHLHYTGWPDHTVPMYTNSVIAYMKKLQLMSTGKGPIIVHCSAGVGRTGTIILCDICLRQGTAKGTIDVLAEFKKLRDCRLNMVDKQLQYVFVHLILVECLLFPPGLPRTELKCDTNFPEAIEEMKKHIPQHIERLDNTSWQDQALHGLMSQRPPLPEQLAKNRFPELAPASSSRVYLPRYPLRDDNSDYISAVIVDGAPTTRQFLASQLPLPSTLSDLWRLIADRKIEVVISLQQPDLDDPTCCEIVPGEEPLNPVPFLNVERKTCSGPEIPHKIVELLLTDTSKAMPRTQRVTVITCTEWELGKNGKPPPPHKLVELWVASEKIHREEGTTLVLCHDGVTGCGLYLAMSYLLERMALARECDISLAVRTIRVCRTEFVQSKEQFEYLYDAAVKYVQSFETYANFA